MAANDSLDETAPEIAVEINAGLQSNPQGPLPPATLALDAPRFGTVPGPQGIGGWLVLVALRLVIAPFTVSRLLWLDLHSLRPPTRLLIGSTVPGLPTLLALEFFINALLLTGLIVLIVLFFREKREFPRLFQIWMGFELVGRAAELTLSFHLGTSSTWAAKVVHNLHAKLGLDVVLTLGATIVWISYFEISERVKATFVN